MIALISAARYDPAIVPTVPDDRLPPIGRNLAARWKLAGFENKSKFAKACGMTPQTYGALEKGRYEWPDLPKLLAAAKVLQCSLDDILLGKDPAYDAIAAIRRTCSDTPGDTQSPPVALQSPAIDSKDPAEPMGRHLGAHPELPSKREIEGVLHALRAATARLDDTTTRVDGVVETLTVQMAQLNARLHAGRKTRTPRAAVAGKSRAGRKPRG